MAAKVDSREVALLVQASSLPFCLWCASRFSVSQAGILNLDYVDLIDPQLFKPLLRLYMEYFAIVFPNESLLTKEASCCFFFSILPPPSKE